MNFFSKKLHEAAMDRVARLPSLLAGEKEPAWTVAQRPTGYYALFRDGVYFKTTGLKKEEDALAFLDQWKLEREAMRDGTVDVRRSPVPAIIEHRIKMVRKKKLRGAEVIASTLKALLPHVEGRQLRHLNDQWLEETEEAMTQVHSRTYFTNAVYFLRTGIRGWCRSCSSEPIMPFDAPPREGGRRIVLHKPQRDRAMRWANGTEAYDPATGRWTAQGCISKFEANCRLVVGRKTYLGLTFGSRPGIYEKLAWEPHAGGGHIDLEKRIFHRVALGNETSATKLAPSVPIPPEAAAEFARWKAADGGSPWLFRNLDGSPMGKGHQATIYRDSMAALGIGHMTGHVLRHTAITMLIEDGESAAAISAVCGISIEVLHKVYDHSDNRKVQGLALGAMDRMMR
jgi:hypothetical protein